MTTLIALIKETQHGEENIYDTIARAARFEELSSIMRALFLESNPVPLKAALSLFGLTLSFDQLPWAGKLTFDGEES